MVRVDRHSMNIWWTITIRSLAVMGRGSVMWAMWLTIFLAVPLLYPSFANFRCHLYLFLLTAFRCLFLQKSVAGEVDVSN